MFVVVRGVKTDEKPEARSRWTWYLPEWRACRMDLEAIVRQILDDGDVEAVDVWDDIWETRRCFTRDGDLIETVTDDRIDVPITPGRALSLSRLGVVRL
ncbi:hypothetical protein [Parafrankia sp. BMG5.11]|uniref:hypothetical protein n=1 Tax=Parafrankia sp. BMG5.11 TaxID=222540 RepID=UPI00103B1152|nr:hypothetical protein [Parafrankia sp. BMG5.11]TCJ35899.1 hypothetical protein E0504_25340 [Parafrankia sp. BMG5.11]